MVIKIRLFAAMAKQARASELTISVPEQTRVENVRDLFKEKFTTLAWPAGTMIAVNQEYASGHRELHDGDEVAIIPPVSGG